jgi:molybdate transport system substrate-binding protein
VVGRAGLGVAVRAGAPRPDIASSDALKRTLLAANSVSFVGDGLSGVLFRGLLDRLAIAEAMKDKLRPTGVANVARAVANGEADLAVHVMPGILAERGVDVIGPLPAEIQSYIDLTAGLSAASREPQAARALIEFMESDAGVRVIKAKGW